MKYMIKNILTIYLLLMSFKTYSQKVDTTFYFDRSPLMITSMVENENTIIAFFNNHGENLIYQNTFEFSFFDKEFMMDRIIKIKDKKMFEDYWYSNSDTIYNEFIFDLDFNYKVVDFLQYVSKNVEYPEMAMEAGIEGKVWVSFIVDKNGEINELKPLTNIGYDLEKETIRIINSRKTFGIIKYNNKPIKLFLRLPTNFTLK
jgi:hypothetical protein